MKPASLLVLAQGFKTVPDPLLAAFESQLAERDEPLSQVKEHEARSVISLVDALQAHGANGPRPFEGFVFSFRIPQISSEFDLLKVCEGSVVDIELKIENVGIDRIERQLTRNRYYLAPLERTIYTFTYVVEDGTLYEMGEDAVLEQTTIERLVSVLGSLGRPYEGRVEDLFRASDYLVSPLNDTDRFLKGSYFLTNHQAQIKASFLRACTETLPGRPPVYLVYGSAGTGKSLLLYDLARSMGMRETNPSESGLSETLFSEGMASAPSVGSRCQTNAPGELVSCVIHCGLLSEGHELLNKQQNSFRIISAKGMEHVNLSSYDALLVDEAQRLWPSQLRRIVDIALSHDMPLYLSLGRRQVVAAEGVEHTAEAIVRSLCDEVSVWELSRKIRTSRELAEFVRILFELPGHPRSVRTRSVKVSSADGTDGATELVETYRSEGYQFIAYTGEIADEPSLDEIDVQGCPNASEVVGQEFDRVVMVIGRRFGADNDTLYRQLLYQGLTRARTHIALVVLDNDTLLARLLEILDT